MKRPTLHDVAREADVSHMTVSRVLRGTKVVKQETVLRVRAAVEKTGYRPDPALSALASYRSKAGGRGHHGRLAFVDCDGTPYSAEVFAGVGEEASLNGYACERFLLPTGADRQRQLARMLFHRGIRGLLFGPSEKPREFAGWDWAEFAMVSLGALCHRPAMHAVSMDYFHGAITACENLRAAGCRRIALVVSPDLEARTGGLWLGGYAAGVIRSQPALVCPAADMRDAARLQRWIAREKVDGVVTIHASLIPVLRANALPAYFLNQQEHGDRYPHYHLPHADIGREGVRLLHHALLRHEFGLPAESMHVALRGTWRPAAVA